MEFLLSAAIVTAICWIILGLLCGFILALIAIWQLHTVGWTPETPKSVFLLKLMDLAIWCGGISTVIAGVLKLIIFII